MISKRKRAGKPDVPPLPATDERVARLLILVDRANLIRGVTLGLAHDLRNALQGAMLGTRALVDLHGTEAGDRLTTTLQNTTERAVESCLRLTQLNSPADEQFGPVVLAEVVGLVQALQRFQRLLPTPELRVSLPTDLPAVRGVRAHLEHALLGLITNAKEAVGRGNRGTVTISARREGEAVYLAVEDTGPGVSRDLMDRVFDPFVTTKTSGPDIGLGLWVARDLLRRSGGDVLLENLGEGKGARAVLQIPIWKS